MAGKERPVRIAPSSATPASGLGAGASAGQQQQQQQPPPPPSPAEISKRTKVSLACNECKTKKTRCDGAKPRCTQCAQNGVMCVYVQTDRRRKEMRDHHTQGLRSHIQQLQQAVRVMTARYGVGDEMYAHLLQNVLEDSPSALMSPVVTTASASASVLSLSPSSATAVQPFEFGGQPALAFESINDDSLPLLSRGSSVADSTISSDRTEQGAFEVRPGPQSVYDLNNLPPLEVVESTAVSFFDGTASLFYITTEVQVRKLIDVVYGGVEGHRLSSLCELCAVAALGSYYLLAPTPPGFRQTCFQTALTSVFDCIEHDALIGMRILICLSLITVLDKRVIARILIAAGLELSRRFELESAERRVAATQGLWRRLTRTLSMIDSWLSFTTRTTACRSDVGLIRFPASSPAISIDDSIQYQLSIVCDLIDYGLKDVLANGYDNLDIAGRHLLQLEAWHNNLPPIMRLPSLTSASMSQEAPSSLSTVQRRSILLLHLMHLGGLILIQMPLVLKVMKSTKEFSDGDLDVQARTQYQNCFLSASAAARIVALLPQEGNIKHCWIVIYKSYCAGVVLLYKSWLDFINENWNELKLSLGYFTACMNILTWCSTDDAIARGFLHRLDVESHQLRGAMSSMALSKRANTEVRQIVTALLGALEAGSGNTEDDEGARIPFRMRMVKLLEEACGYQVVTGEEPAVDGVEVDGVESG